MRNNITTIQVEVDRQWLSEEHSEVEIKLDSQNGKYCLNRATFINRSNKTVKFGGFRFKLNGLNDVPGERLRLYREGWTMASAAASVRYGECDFESDPDYLKYAVSAPEHYDSATPNRFAAEHVMVLNDRDTGNSLLAGFVTSADQLSRFSIELNEAGVKDFFAFSCGDGMEVEAGETVISEELVIMTGSDGYTLLEEFADLWGERMKARSWQHVPTGWCSWYYYFENITEADMLENINFLDKNREEFPLEYIQLDDGYQAALGDWLTCNEKFPSGLEFLAGKITEAGFKPALWLAPFMVEESSQLYAEHPDWLVHDADGNIVSGPEWRGSNTAVLDGTHPEVQTHLFDTFTTLAKWGFEYVKLDFLVYACSGTGGSYYDKKATRAQALRRGMAAIRKAMGDRFILGCTTPLGPVVGIVNGERVGTDITPYWQGEGKIYKEAPAVHNVCRNIINRSYMNGRLWISDSDTHIARIDNNKLTEDEVVLWTFALYLTGGMMLLSDRFETLTPERAALSKLLLAEPGIFSTRPLDFFEREYPAIWLRHNPQNGEILIGLFNFTANEENLTVDFSRIDPTATFVVTDFHTGNKLASTVTSFSSVVTPHSCQIITLKEKTASI
jgi:alpha-galactosidase